MVLKPGGHNPKVPTITWISAFDYMPKAVNVRMFQKGNHYKWDSTHHKGVELIGNFVIILTASLYSQSWPQILGNFSALAS